MQDIKPPHLLTSEEFAELYRRPGYHRGTNYDAAFQRILDAATYWNEPSHRPLRDACAYVGDRMISERQYLHRAYIVEAFRAGLEIVPAAYKDREFSALTKYRNPSIDELENYAQRGYVSWEGVEAFVREFNLSPHRMTRLIVRDGAIRQDYQRERREGLRD